MLVAAGAEACHKAAYLVLPDVQCQLQLPQQVRFDALPQLRSAEDMFSHCPRRHSTQPLHNNKQRLADVRSSLHPEAGTRKVALNASTWLLSCWNGTMLVTPSITTCSQPAPHQEDLLHLSEVRCSLHHLSPLLAPPRCSCTTQCRNLCLNRRHTKVRAERDTRHTSPAVAACCCCA